MWRTNHAGGWLATVADDVHVVLCDWYRRERELQGCRRL